MQRPDNVLKQSGDDDESDFHDEIILPEAVKATTQAPASIITAQQTTIEEMSVRRVRAGIYTNSAAELDRVSPAIVASLQRSGLLQAPSPLLSTGKADIKKLFVEEIDASLMIDQNELQQTPMGNKESNSSIPITIHHHTQITAGVAIVSAPSPEIKIAALTQQLKYNYAQNDSEIQRIFGNTLSLQECFINLAIVKSEQQKEIELEKLKLQSERLQIDSSYEEIYSLAKKEVFYPTQLFDERDKRIPRRIVIIGRAGIGKSVLGQYLSAYLWAIKNLWSEKFDAVIKIKLRNLTLSNYKIQSTLADIIEIECLDRSGLTVVLNKADITATMQVISKKALFILDGIDEYNPDNSPCKNIIDNILKNPDASIIALTRPYAELNLPSFDLKLECIGFTDANINQYIMKVCEDKTQIPLIKEFLSRNIAIHNLAHIPIILDIICSMWDQEMCAQSQPMTMTRLYCKMMAKLWEVYKKKQYQLYPAITLNELKSKKDNAQKLLNLLAFKAMSNDSIMLDFDLVNSTIKEVYRCRDEDVTDYLKEILPAGLLNTPDHHRKNGRYYFPHLTFQEFLMAEYLLNQSDKQISTWMSEHKYHPKYQLVLIFLCGLMLEKNGVEGSKQFFTVLEQPPRDLTGIYHDILIAHCLNECGDKIQACDNMASTLRLLPRLEAKLENEVNHYDHSPFIKADLNFLPHLYYSKLINFFINQIGKDNQKNYDAINALSELGIPTDKKYVVFSKLLNVYHLEALKKYAPKVVAEIPQYMIDSFVDSIIKVWPTQYSSDGTTYNIIDIAQTLAIYASHEKKMLISEKFIPMLKIEYKCINAANALAFIGLPIADSAIVELLEEASNKDKLQANKSFWRDGECILCLSLIYTLTTEQNQNHIIKVLIEELNTEKYKSIIAIRPHIPNLSEKQRSQVFTALKKIILNKSECSRDEAFEVILELFDNIPSDIKPEISQMLMNCKKEFMLELILKFISNNNTPSIDLINKLMRNVSYGFSRDKKENIIILIEKLNAHKISIFLKSLIEYFKDYDSRDIQDYFEKLISLYPKNELMTLMNEFIVGIDSENKIIQQRYSKIFVTLLTETFLTLTEKQMLFDLLCDKLEGKATNKIIILQAFEKIDKKLELFIKRLIAIKLKLIQENINLADKDFIIELLKFSCYLRTYYGTGRYQHVDNYECYLTLLNLEQVKILFDLLLNIISHEINVQYSYSKIKIRKYALELLYKLANIYPPNHLEVITKNLHILLAQNKWGLKLEALDGFSQIASIFKDDDEIHTSIIDIKFLLTDDEEIVRRRAQDTIITLCSKMNSTKYLDEQISYATSVIVSREKENEYTVENAIKLIDQLFIHVTYKHILQVLEALINCHYPLRREAGSLFIKLVKLCYGQGQNSFVATPLNPIDILIQIREKIDKVLEIFMSYTIHVNYKKGLVDNYENDNWLAQPFVTGTVRDTIARDQASNTLFESTKYLPPENIQGILTKYINIYWQYYYYSYNNIDSDHRENMTKASEWLSAVSQTLSDAYKRFVINTLLTKLNTSIYPFSQVMIIFVAYKNTITEAQSQIIVDMYFNLRTGQCLRAELYGYHAQSIINIIPKHRKNEFIQKLIAIAESGDTKAKTELELAFNMLPDDKKKTVFLLIFKNLDKYALGRLYSNLVSHEDKIIIIGCLIEILYSNGSENDKLKIPEMLSGKQIPIEKKSTIINSLLKLKSRNDQNSIASEVKSFLKEMDVPDLFSIFMTCQESHLNVQAVITKFLCDKILQHKISIVCTQISKTIIVDIYTKPNKVTLEYSEDCKERLIQFIEYTNKVLFASVDLANFTHSLSFNNTNKQTPSLTC